MATEGDDIIYGTSAAEVLDGGAGNDKIFGRGGDDHLTGGLGDDQLFGDGGDDTFRGGEGNDRIFGGTGTDTVNYYHLGAVTVDLSQGLTVKADGTTDQLSSIENILGSLNDDIIIGDDGDNYIDGYYGWDTITLGGGRDTYSLNDHSEIIDTITDFESGEDTIRLHPYEVFRDGDHRPPLGRLGEEYFIEGTQAQTPTQYLIYNPETHAIYYDPDGSGTYSGPDVLIYLSEGATVVASDFLIG